MSVTAVWPGFLESSLNEVSDLELVKRTKKGDTDSFSELMKRHQGMVYNLAFRFMRDTSLAEDMAQEAFLKGFRLLKGFRGDCSFSTWMYRVTCSVCLTELSRRKKRSEVPLLPEHIGAQEDSTVEASDFAEIIRGCVTKLPDRYATVVTLYYLNEMAYDEIASILEIPIGTLKTWMFRARKELRKIVERELADNAPPSL